ncbi:dyslexia-associated protein KIAA0319-like protein [Pomacea canaliculata]|uniref:dyslexia-associated protein KIAA0319-like protein n=1 Tax=Pomacea canaliculata TaxID=400727 RepID=UPI000D72A618|nr:dyslexia-associated protein KIAA0319-like protein [Pomacea canaliculata]
MVSHSPRPVVLDYNVVLTMSLLVALLISQGSASFSDLCQASDVSSTEKLKTSVFFHSRPKGGKRAGTISRIPEVDDMAECVLACCTLEQCDVILFVNGTCYTIKCNVSYPFGCTPDEDPRLSSTMVVVREPAYFLQEPKKSLPTPSLAMAEKLTSPISHQNTEPAKTCEYGIEECAQNEECILESTRSRQGYCRCLKNYQRSAQGVCQLTPSATPSVSAPAGPEASGHEDSGKTTAKSETPAVTKLTVSAGENKVLQLPENSLTLSAFVLPKAQTGEEYHYEWSPLSMPEGAEEATIQEGKNTDTLKLSKLIAGLYRLKVTVTGENKFGDAYVNVTVLAPKRTNSPPVAIIKPSSQVVKTENSFVLDGSDSQDDDKVVSYHWEEVSGPLQEHNINSDSSMLRLQNLAPGFYVLQVQLTVTDTDGATNSTSANVTVIKETDYPPKADAGSDVVINLPQNSVVLCGNASTDDKGIAAYEWFKSTDSLTGDMTGVRTPCLQLNNLERGDYAFTLKVTDTGGNTNTATVHVFVKQETNRPPEARTAGEITVLLPTESFVLDGRNSTDDKGTLTYKWTQEGGATPLTLSSSDQAVAIVTGDIKVGEYQFLLTVTDREGQSSSQKLKVTVKMNENHPPVARAGGDREVMLPVSLVTLDGSASSDDHGIASYAWQRDVHSLGAGDVINGSDHQAVLQLMNLVAGSYIFTLTITDTQGLTSSDMVHLLVKNGEEYKDLVEMVLDTDIHHFSQDNKLNMVNQLELLLHQSSARTDTSVHIHSLQGDFTTGNLRLIFFVRQKDGHTLNSRTILSYDIILLDTLLCQNNCSGHGHCDQRTKLCLCEAFWMSNFIKASMWQHGSNCEWSILYVVIVSFVVMVAIITGVWGVICCCLSKRCRIKTKKRHRYSLLRDEDQEERDDLELMQKGKIQNSSVMVSESDFSSEEETLFVSGKPQNGHLKPLNGMSKHLRPKPKA